MTMFTDVSHLEIADSLGGIYRRETTVVQSIDQHRMNGTVSDAELINNRLDEIRNKTLSSAHTHTHKQTERNALAYLLHSIREGRW